MKKIQFYQLLVICLVVLNITTIAFFWMKKPGHPGKPDPREIVELLDLKGEKAKEILALQEKHFVKKGALVKARMDLHVKLFDSFNDPNSKQSTSDSLIDKIVENERVIETMTYAYFKKINALCDVTQRKELSKLIRKVLTHPQPPPPRKK